MVVTLLNMSLPADAFWAGKLTKQEENTCRTRASRVKNSFSAKQIYNECKRTIKKQNKVNLMEKEWKECMKPYELSYEKKKKEAWNKFLQKRKEKGLPTEINYQMNQESDRKLIQEMYTHELRIGGRFIHILETGKLSCKQFKY